MKNDDKSSDLVIFEEDSSKIPFKADGETIWGTTKHIAQLFECAEQNIDYHTINIDKEKELSIESSTKDFLVDGVRKGKPDYVKHYNLDMMISIGFRVNSKKAVKFRKWSTQVIKSVAMNGYAIDHAKIMNNPNGQRQLALYLRKLRNEERSFYGVVRKVFKESSSDYDSNSQTARSFFAKAQDKFHYAVTTQTSAELILERAGSDKPNMGLRTSTKEPPLSTDVVVGKNYLNEEELEALEVICEQFLLFAQSKAMRGHKMTMDELSHKLDSLLEFNGYPVLYEYKHFLRKKADKYARSELKKYKTLLKAEKKKEQLQSKNK